MTMQNAKSKSQNEILRMKYVSTILYFGSYILDH